MMREIYVHEGVFHADDTMIVALIMEAMNLSWLEININRVRELPDSFNSANGDIAGDVGGCFDVKKMIFDHHFKNGNDDGFAATGKFWSHFGSRICGYNQRVADRVYLTLLGSIDRADIALSDWTPIREDWRHVSASALISSMNPPFGSSSDEIMKAFNVAVNTCRYALKGAIENAKTFISMEDVVSAAEKHLSGRVLVFSKGGPWQEHIFEQKLEDVLYVIYVSERGGFCLQCVPDALGSFGTRKSLPESWKGLRGAELNQVLGGSFTESSSLFCHPGRFMGGAETLEETLEMARMAIES